MGYETRIYIVDLYSFESEVTIDGEKHSIRDGAEIASLELSKVGYDGPLPDLISRTKPSEPKVALWAFNPSRQQEGVEVLRDLNKELESIKQPLLATRAYELWERAGRPEGQDLEFWIQAEHDYEVFKNDLPGLSNDLEDGQVFEDCYGNYIGVCTVDEFLTALEGQMKIDDYRRLKWAHTLITTIRDGMGERERESLRIFTYGH